MSDKPVHCCLLTIAVLTLCHAISAAELKADPQTLAAANASAMPGDTVILADGDYKTPIAPQHSGEGGKPIVFKSATRRKAVFSDPKLDGAVQLEGKSFIVIDGIHAAGCQRCLVCEKCSHITINDCFLNQSAESKSWESCRFRECGDGIVFTSNQATGGNDILALWKGSGHRIENNFFGDATHTSLVFIAVQRSVVRGNCFRNRQWKCMEVFSDRSPPELLSQHNLIEGNRFEYSPSSAIQYAGNDSILRRNVFWRVRSGMNFAHYLGRARTPEAWYNNGNRFYNNIIADCGSIALNNALIAEADRAGVKVAEPKDLKLPEYGLSFATNYPGKGPFGRPCGDQAIVNNILYRNGTGQLSGDCSATVQVAFDWDATPAVAILLNNCFFSGQPGANLFYWMDAKDQKPSQPRSQSLKDFQERFPKNLAHNFEADPLFEDPEAGDFRLKPASPCLGAGAFLTRAAGAGEGTSFPVQDARWFCDGFGIEGLAGDEIQLEGQTARARIINVDYAKNILTLATPLKWIDGQGVALPYSGKAPDAGAYELGARQPAMPESP